MHQGALLAPTQAGGKRRGGGQHRQSCGWGGRSTTPASWPLTTSSTYPATESPRAAGTAPGPAAWGWRAKHRWPGSRPCSRAATRQLASSSARPHGSNAVPASVVLRPTKSVSVLYGLGDPATGRAVCRPIMLGWPKQWPIWTSAWALAVAMAVSSTCPARGCWRSGSTTGRPGRAIRCHIPIWWWPIGSKVRTDAGPPWTAGTPVSHRLAADAIYRATYQ